MSERVLVLGAGYAGVRAVQRLEDQAPQAEVIWISDEPYHFALHEAHKLIRTPGRRKRITVPVDDLTNSARFVEGEVTSVEQDVDRVSLADGRKITYDYLVLAIGGETPDFGIPGVAEHAHTLKSRSDAMEIATDIREGTLDASHDDPLRVVVGGAGLSGIQTAGEVAAYRDKHNAPVEVSLLEAQEHVLPNGDPDLQMRLRKLLDENGVDIHTGVAVEEVSETEVVADDEQFPQDMFVWTGGVTGASEVSDNELADDSGRIAASTTLQTDDESVFAVGDVAAVDIDGVQVPPTAQAARQAGKVAGENVARLIDGEQLEEWEYTDRGTLVSVGDDVVAHGVKFAPRDTFGGSPAKVLKKGISEAWIESLTSPIDYYDLLPSPMKNDGNAVESVFERAKDGLSGLGIGSAVEEAVGPDAPSDSSWDDDGRTIEDGLPGEDD